MNLSNCTSDSKNSLMFSAKVIAVIAFVLSIAKYFFPATMYQYMMFSSSLSVDIVIRWAISAGSVFLIMATFYKNQKMAACARWIIMPLSVMSAILLPRLIMVNLELSNATDTIVFSIVCYLELFCYIAAGIILGFIEKKTEVKPLQVFKNFLLVVLVTIPLNILDFLGNVISEEALPSLIYRNFGVWQLLAIVLLLAVTCSIYFYLKKKSEKDKWEFLTVLALCFILIYVTKLSIGRFMIYQNKHFGLLMLPLYICDMGALLIPIAYLTKKKFFFDCLFFVNAVGALSVFVYMGIDSLNTNPYIFTYNYLYFVLSHALLFALCIMPTALKLYKPQFKGIFNGILVFTLFYVAAAIMSAVIYTIPCSNPLHEAMKFHKANFSYTQTCPLPFKFNFPITEIGGLSFNFPYIALAYCFYLAMFFGFYGVWKLVELIAGKIKNKINFKKSIKVEQLN